MTRDNCLPTVVDLDVLHGHDLPPTRPHLLKREHALLKGQVHPSNTTRKARRLHVGSLACIGVKGVHILDGALKLCLHQHRRAVGGTSFDSKGNETKPVHITVTLDSATDPEAAKRAVMDSLDRFLDRVRVTVKAG